MNITTKQTKLISSFAVDFGGGADDGHGIKKTRHAGFTMLELIVTLAIIAIIAGFAVFGIRAVLPGLQADRAMYQVVASLREARMLAMSQNRRVSIQFPTNQRILAQFWDAGGGQPILNGIDPSTSFENGYQFVRHASIDTPYNTAGGIQEAIVFGGISIEPDNEIVFTTEGFLTTNSDFDDPINGVVFIGLPNDTAAPSRAVTILGATGRISTWRWQLATSEWNPVKK